MIKSKAKTTVNELVPIALGDCENILKVQLGLKSYYSFCVNSINYFIVSLADFNNKVADFLATLSKELKSVPFKIYTENSVITPITENLYGKIDIDFDFVDTNAYCKLKAIA